MLVDHKINASKISYKMLRVVWKLFEADKRTRTYGTGIPLFEAEIHMIKHIQENEGMHITGLAEMLSVTKGAVSQIIMKLTKKGMVTKETDPANLSRLVLHLTEKGIIAYNHHEKLHQAFDTMVQDALEGASEDNIIFLKSYLDTLEKEIDAFAENES